MSEPTEEQLDQEQKLLEQLCAKLGEHWQNVQIFVNRVDEGGEYFTQLTYGIGNWHARQNQVREWITIGEEIARCKARENCRRSSDDGDDEDEE